MSKSPLVDVEVKSVVEVDAKGHDVTSVTVYQRRAEIMRRFQLKLEAGQSNVEISNLPTCMEESSLRVDGLGNAVIFDVIHEHVPQTTTIRPESTQRVRELEDEQAKVRRQLNALKSQTRVLDDFSHSLTAKDVNPTQLVDFLDVLAAKGLTFSEEVDRLSAEDDRLRREIELERTKERPRPEHRKLATKVTVIVLAEEAGSAELQLTYVVSLADWKPLYDLRATVEPSGKDATAVSLSYRASISQTTGEDWNNVNLVLSTSSPLSGADIPQLTAHRIGAERPKPPPFVKRAKAAPQVMARMAISAPRMASFNGASEESYGSEPPPPPMMAMPTATASEGAISASFKIDGLSTIPSDGATHKVAIGILNLTASLEWIAVPKLNTSAFLQCTITNSSPYVLLSGPSNVFLDGSFVAKSTLPYVTPQDTFSCSVGVDPAIRIEYQPQSKKARPSGSLFSSKIDTTVFTQLIKVSNKRQTPIKLNVRDQVPVSDDAKFKVNVLEPKDLATAPVGKALSVQPGVLCFWARKDWDKSAFESTIKRSSQPANIPDGQVEWECQIGAGKSCELVLSWEVSGPVGEAWATY